MPLEAMYKTANSRITFKVTGESPKALFKEIAELQDIFEVEECCGICGSDFKFKVRITGDRGEYSYYELACKNPTCRAQFSFGQSKDQKTIFPKRKDDDGNWLPNRGWAKYVAEAHK